MNPIRKRALTQLVFLLLVLATVLALVLYALRQNISLFYTPTQVRAGEVPLKHRIRVGGMVEKGSILRSEKGLAIQFKITDFTQVLTVHYSGLLPDLFREGQGVVAEGEARADGVFYASQVLAKHDANYMPPEVKAVLADKGNT